MGLFYMELCREEQSVNIDYTNNIVTILSFRYNDGDSIDHDPKETVVTQLTKSEYTMRMRSQNTTITSQELSKVCQKIRLKQDMVGDGISVGSALALSAIIFWFLAWVGVLNMILHASHKKRMAQLIEKKKSVDAVIYDTKTLKRAQSFMKNQISLLRLFSSSNRVNQSVSAMSDSSDATSE